MSGHPVWAVVPGGRMPPSNPHLSGRNSTQRRKEATAQRGQGATKATPSPPSDGVNSPPCKAMGNKGRGINGKGMKTISSENKFNAVNSFACLSGPHSYAVYSPAFTTSHILSFERISFAITDKIIIGKDQITLNPYYAILYLSLN